MANDVGYEWVSTGWAYRPKDAREVMSVLGAIGVYNSRQSFAWRGMSSADYPLTSSLQRTLEKDVSAVSEETIRSEELRLLAAAREWGLGLGSHGGQVDDLQLLADLQHYGIATRLLDFTSNPMTALWFACQTPKTPGAGKSGILLALNITSMPELSTVQSGPVTWHAVGNPTGSALQLALERKEPFVVRSAVPNERLRAQEGFFVAGATPERHSEQIFLPSGQSFEFVPLSPIRAVDISWTTGDSDRLARNLRDDRSRGNPVAMPFVAVIIKAGLKAKLLRYLENTYNKSARTLFPDYAGFLEFSPQPEARTPVAD